MSQALLSAQASEVPMLNHCLNLKFMTWFLLCVALSEHALPTQVIPLNHAWVILPCFPFNTSLSHLKMRLKHSSFRGGWCVQFNNVTWDLAWRNLCRECTVTVYCTYVKKKELIFICNTHHMRIIWTCLSFRVQLFLLFINQWMNWSIKCHCKMSSGKYLPQFPKAQISIIKWLCV